MTSGRSVSKPNPSTKRTTAGLLTAGMLSLALASPASAALAPDNAAPQATDDLCSTAEDTAVDLPVLDNDVDPDSTLTIVEIDGTPIAPGGTAGVSNGTATLDPSGSVTFTPAAEFSGSTSFTYTVAEMVATGPAGVSYHLESTTDNGPVVFMIDLTSGAKTVIGQLTIGSTTAMAYDSASGLLYFIRANGDLYSYDPHTPVATAALVGNIENASNWTDAVPTAYSHQTASFYNGSLYLVPTARPAPTVDDVLYRVDFIDPATIDDVVKVADMSGNTVGWNNNDDIAIDPTTGILYGRSDLNDQTNSQRSSFFYSYDLASGTWNMIIEDLNYAYDYVTSTNNPTSRNDFRDASIGLIANNGRVFGTHGRGNIGELDPVTGAWTALGAFVPDDGDLSVGGDLGHNAPYLRTSTATVSCTVSIVNDPPVAANDTVTTPAGTPVIIDPLAGNGADSDVDGTVDPTSVTLVVPTGAVVNTDGSITVAGVGTWTVNPVTGAVTFTPEAGFSGVASIDYTVTDDGGLLSAPATISAEVAAAAQLTTSTTAPTTSTTAPTTSTTTNTPGTLAFTGGESGWLAALGSVLIAAGAVLLSFRQRRLVIISSDQQR